MEKFRSPGGKTKPPQPEHSDLGRRAGEHTISYYHKE
jgi:hypothetical protein